MQHDSYVRSPCVPSDGNQQKLLVCDRCGYIATFTSVMRRHKERKTDCAPSYGKSSHLKSYRCSLCPKQFSHSSGLYRHKAHAHAKEPVTSGSSKYASSAEDDKLTVNPFGKEDVSFIPQYIMDRFLEGTFMGLVNLIRCVHFSEHSQGRNRNLAITNKSAFIRQHEIYVLAKNLQWVLSDRTTIMDSLISENFKRLYRHFYNSLDDMEGRWTTIQRHEIEHFLEALAHIHRYPKDYKSLMNQLQIMLIGNAMVSKGSSIPLLT